MSKDAKTLADIKFMLPDPIPLISANVLKAAAQQAKTAGTPESTPARTNADQAQRLQAEVVSAKAQGDHYQITLKIGSQTLTVNSDIPLPEGTELKLEVRAQVSPNQGQGQAVQNKGPTLSVTDIQLPDGAKSSPSPAAMVTTAALAKSPVIIPASDQATRSTTLPLSTMPTHNTTLTEQKQITDPLTRLLQPSQQQPAALTSFLAARLPLLSQNSVTTRVSADIYTQTIKQPPAATIPADSTDAGNISGNISGNGTKNPETNIPPSLIRQLMAAITTPTNAPAQQNFAPGIPQASQNVLHEWQQQLPDTALLRQPDTIRQLISNSGPSYEQKLLALAERLRSQSYSAPEQTGRNNTSSNRSDTGVTRTATTMLPGSVSQAADKVINQTADQLTNPIINKTTVGSDESLSARFRNLWTKAAPLLSGNTTASSQAMPTAKTDNLTDALAQARTTLEKTLMESAPDALQHLLKSDHKAVLARALLIWMNHLRPTDTPAMRELPIAPRLNMNDVPETFRLLQTALAQTETEQAARLQSAPDNLLNIPLFFRQGEQLREVRLQLRHDEHNTGNENNGKKITRWHLLLHFDLEQLGPLDAELDLSLPQLSATFWSERQETLTTLNQTLQPLRQTLVQMGVDVSELQARFGSLPAISRNQISQRLVDTHS